MSWSPRRRRIRRRGGRTTCFSYPNVRGPAPEGGAHMQWLKRLIGREQKVKHRPVARNEWERLVRRADLPEAAKLIALVMATYANPDGSNVRPGDELLADLCDWSQKHVREQMKTLRSYGLIECVSPATRKHAAVYQLTFPGEETDPVGMRVDPDGVRVTERVRGRGGRKARLTGTPVPVNGSDEGNWSSGDSGDGRNSSSGHGSDEGNSSSGQTADDRNSSSGQDGSEGPMAGTGVPVTESSPELEFPMTGTGVPDDRNSSSPHHYKTNTKTNPVVPSDLTRTSDQDQQRGGEIDHSARGDAEPDPNAAYRRARKILDEAAPDERDRALSAAAADLRNTGRSGVRAQTIRAAEIIDALNVQAWADLKDSL